MILADLHIQPVSIYLSDVSEYWDKRLHDGVWHFKERGIKNILWVKGIHAENSGVEAARVYDRDPQNVESGWKIPQKTVGNYLSWYMAFNVMNHVDAGYFMLLEDDVRLDEGWKIRAEQAIYDAPDFEYLILGHCCTEGKETSHIKGEVYDVKYPQAGVPAIVKKSAIAKVLQYATNASYPFDVNLHDFVFKHMKVYTLIPRLSSQVDTFLPQ